MAGGKLYLQGEPVAAVKGSGVKAIVVQRTKKSRKPRKKKAPYDGIGKAVSLIKNDVKVIRPTHLATLPKRTMTRHDVTVRLTLGSTSQQYNYGLIKLNSLNAMFSEIVVDDWSLSQNFSPSLPNQVAGRSIYLNNDAYKRYQVHAGKINVTVKPQSGLDSGRFFIGVVPSTQAVPSGETETQVAEWFNNPDVMTWDYSSNYTEKNNTRACYVRCCDVEGLSKSEYNSNPDFYGSITQLDPGLLQNWIIGYHMDNPSTTTSGIVAFNIDLCYFVEYFDRVTNQNTVTD